MGHVVFLPSCFAVAAVVTVVGIVVTVFGVVDVTAAADDAAGDAAVAAATIAADEAAATDSCSAERSGRTLRRRRISTANGEVTRTAEERAFDNREGRKKGVVVVARVESVGCRD
mmetsp:Transcript_28670/g.48803  ORF Transcript_28670/g.48803 Transcript_28670/m.48803 type:complete len:115 (+) Transcript_28670:801-1145(+)